VLANLATTAPDVQVVVGLVAAVAIPVRLTV